MKRQKINSAQLMLDLLYGKKELTCADRSVPLYGIIEEKVIFEPASSDEILDGQIKLCNHKNHIIPSSIRELPLDFDCLSGLSDVFKLIAAFWYPHKRVQFSIYELGGEIEQIYVLKPGGNGTVPEIN